MCHDHAVRRAVLLLTALLLCAGCSSANPPTAAPATSTAVATPVPDDSAFVRAGDSPCVVPGDVVGTAFGLGTTGGLADAEVCVLGGLDTTPGSPTNSELVVEASVQRLTGVTPSEVQADPQLLPGTSAGVGVDRGALSLSAAPQYGPDGAVGSVTDAAGVTGVQVFLGADGHTWVTTVVVHPDAHLGDDETVAGTSQVFDQVYTAAS